MKLYFLRHPETLANKQGLIYGWNDYGYTEKGEEMFAEMPARMDKYNFDKIYTSPLGRAKRLAEAIAERTGLECVEEPRIKEMNFGLLEGMPYMEAKEKFPEVVAKIFNDLEHFTVPGGENTDDVLARAEEFFDTIKEDEGAVLIVTHAMFLHTAMAALLGFKRRDMWHFKIDPCMIIRIDYNDGFGVLKEMIPYEESDGTYIVDVQ